MAKQLLEKAASRFTPDQIARLEKAVIFATEKHKGQLRASGDEYITHPMAVANILINWDMDIDTVITGVLHDTIEDTETTVEEISEEFGEIVAFLTDGVTKLGRARKGMREIDNYLPQTKDNLTKLLLALGADIRVVIVKLADRLHNLRTLDSLSPERQKKIAKESLEIFAPISDRLNMGRVRVELEELSFFYIDQERYKYLTELTKQQIASAKNKHEKAKREINKLLSKEKITHELDGRVKSIYSLHKKLRKHHENIEEIYDILAMRIVVKDQTSCYLVLGLLHSLYRPMVDRIKDYIAVPKSNGYQSLHTTVITPDGQIIEFQIRTKDMHEYAEFGLAASFHYNEQKLTDAYTQGRIAALPTNLHWIRDLQKTAARLKTGEEVDIDALKIDLFANWIFVYSPKGDIFDLPEGATALDFAYRVHTDVGRHAYAVKIKGHPVQLDEILKTGDIVEIITRKNSEPNADWLRKVKTGHSKDKIRQQLRKKI